MPDTDLRSLRVTDSRTVGEWLSDLKLSLLVMQDEVQDGSVADALDSIEGLREDLDRLRLALEPHTKEEDDG